MVTEGSSTTDFYVPLIVRSFEEAHRTAVAGVVIPTPMSVAISPFHGGLEDFDVVKLT